MKVASRTHVGNVRPSNQDALLILPGKYGLYGVADGMGGHKAGDVASQMAVVLLARVLEGVRPREDLLRGGIEEVNQAIFEEQKKDEALSGMGTTLTVIWEDENRVLLGHVGDSRAYLLRDGVIRQISVDHSMVGEMLRDGLITPEQALRHPYRNVITRALGAAGDVEVDITVLNKQAGDQYLICSDGLSEYVMPQQMADVMTALPLEEAADTFLRLALEGGGRDNISVVLAEVTA
ncbi:MAG: Stp1/IreP family PP2C-type Ser/Thr phosphatase [Clostridia bacterium]|nr:Stp1/IreP family PP2C-type Ser/Thr phosphatase [Clostridia bacterium]